MGFSYNYLVIEFYRVSPLVNSTSSMCETTLLDTISTATASINSVPSALPTPTSAPYEDQTQTSPSIKIKSYKKIKTDDMDK